MTKPLIKWTGGKTQIVDTLLEIIPKEIDNYHEIFLGGGSVLIKVIESKRVNGKIFAYDVNEQLIRFYKDVQNRPLELYNITKTMVDMFLSLSSHKATTRNPKTHHQASQSREAYYYWIRKIYNNSPISIERSAIFLFLNKTSFRGLYRVGPNGYNVPYGHNKNPQIIDKEHLLKVSDLIQGVEFHSLSFENSLKTNIKENDFVYLDPPYVQENSTSFVGYTKNGFEFHEILFRMIKELNCKWLLSNSNTDIVKKSFENYHTREIIVRRQINSKNPGNKTSEILINN